MSVYTFIYLSICVEENKSYLIQWKNFWFLNGNIKRMKTDTAYGKKGFARHMSGTVLVFRIDEELSKLNHEEKILIMKWAKDFQRHFFTKEDIWLANMHLENSQPH